MVARRDFSTYSSDLLKSLEQVNENEIELAIRLISELGKEKIFVAGNGGSASLADHFCNDLFKVFDSHKKRNLVMSLVANNSILTATSNDFAYDQIFIRQLSIYAEPKDLFIAISSSGNSTNLIEAVRFCNILGVKTIALTGFSGGKLREISQFSVYVPTVIGDYGIAEDAHSSICHYIADSVRRSLEIK